MRGTTHDVGSSILHTETHSRRAGGDYDDPEYLNCCASQILLRNDDVRRTRTEREHGQPLVILESEPDEKHHGLPDITSEQVKGESLDVVEGAASLTNGRDDGSEIVVGQDDI